MTTTRKRTEGRQHQPKEWRGTKPSLGGAAFSCSFWALRLFPPPFGVLFPPRFPFWMLLLSHIVLLGGAAVFLSPSGLRRFAPLGGVPFPPLLLCLWWHHPKGKREGSTTTQREEGRKQHHSEGGGKAAAATRRRRRRKQHDPTREDAAPYGWCCLLLFVGGAAFLPLLLWSHATVPLSPLPSLPPFVFGSGAALVGAAVPSSFGVAWCCFSPLGWWCLLIHPSFQGEVR